MFLKCPAKDVLKCVLHKEKMDARFLSISSIGLFMTLSQSNVIFLVMRMR